MTLKSPAKIAEAMVGIGKTKMNLSIIKMLILSIFAGVYIGFGAILATTVTQDLSAYTGVGFSKFMGGAVFSVGLMLVVICGSELFTGNNLIPIAVFEKEATWGQALKSWGVVYLGNFVGSLLLALIYFGTGLWKTEGVVNNLGNNAVAIANGKCALTFGAAFFRGILCNILVCLAVWLAVSSDTTIGRIWACFFPIMAFVASGFEHSVANMYFILIGIFIGTDPTVTATTSSLGLGNMIIKNLIPVTLGNMVGGVIFIAFLYWFVYLRKKKTDNN